MFNYKPYRYNKGENPAVDAEFAAAPSYGKVRPGKTVVFWKSGLFWHVISLEHVQRIFRRVEPVYGKLCCGRKTFIIERLVLILKDGTEVELYIGDDLERQAKALLESLKSAHPGIAYGKG